jgi:uncharacterized protein
MQHDFKAGILEETAHRPWPMPREPWIMTQTWHDLLFAHWPVDADRIASMLPASIELDTFGGAAWLGVVPFRMTNVAPRAFPALPWLSAFPELNVRTYVRWRGERPGVLFMSLDAANPIAVWTARVLFHLPYYRARMRVERSQDAIAYRSRRVGRRDGDATLVATYGPVGPVYRAMPGSLEYFLTERYCLYTTDRRGRPLRVEIHHPPWRLQPAEAVFQANTMPQAAGLALPPGPPLLHFSRRQDAVAWRPVPAV